MILKPVDANSVFSVHRISYAERSEPLSIPIHLSRVECDGSERSILNCSTSSVDLSTVTHLQDAYVVCRPRLVDYSGKCLGSHHTMHAPAFCFFLDEGREGEGQQCICWAVSFEFLQSESI